MILVPLIYIYDIEVAVGWELDDICLLGRGGGGGGTQVQRGCAPAFRISWNMGSFFKTSACPRFCKRRVLFCTQVRSMGVKIPLHFIHEIYAALTPSDSRCDWASEFSAATCCR